MLTTNQNFTEPFGNISINGHELDIRSEGKFLGIILDNKLKFNHHTKYVSNKLSKSIGIIHRLKAFLPSRCLFSLYHSFIYPYLTYCNIIWGNTYNTHLKPLETLQKRAIRLINKQSHLAPTKPLFHSSNLLTLADIHKYLVSVYMFKNRNSLNHNRHHHHHTRNHNQLLPSFRRLTTTQQSLSYSGPKIWNSLPDNVKNCKSVNTFKRTLKKFYVTLYNS